MIYLDHHAATPLTPAVRAAMAQVLACHWANPASVHRAGRAARAALEQARRAVAAGLGAQPADVVLAGGGTEACNLALVGLVRALAPGAPKTLVTTAIEHPAMANGLAALAAEGYAVETLALPGGVPFSPQQLEARVARGAACVVIQWVNHETGTVLPVAEYARVCASHGVPLVVDACQALGKLPLDVRALGASVVVVAASKIGGPAGASALWHERGVALSPVIQGGGQERGLRPGTPDLPALVGFGEAMAGLSDRLAAMARLARLRDELERACVALGATVNGAGGARVATVTNLSFPGWRGAVLVAALDVEGVCASSGAACSSGLNAPSPVLRSMYPDEPWRAESALRLSLGPDTTEGEIAQTVALLGRVLARSRAGRGP